MSFFSSAAEKFGKAAIAVGRGVKQIEGGQREVFGEIADPAADIDQDGAHDSILMGTRRDNQGIGRRGERDTEKQEDEPDIMDMRLF